MGKWKHHRDPIERFLEKVCISPDGCWIWTGARLNKAGGYGTFSFQLRQIRAHRFSYETWVGPIPDGLELDHLCRVPACVCPEHLEPVTHAVNMARGGMARRTHCPQGHPYEGDNVFFDKNGYRFCRSCKRQRDHRDYAKRSKQDR